MNFIITGTNNAVGNRILFELIKKKNNIIIISSNKKRTLVNLNQKNLKIKVYSYTEIKKIKLNIKKQKWHFLHFGGSSGSILNNKNILDVSNIQSTKKILQFIKINKVKSFYFLSTLSVFDITKDITIDKNTIENPKNYYGKVKYHTEKMIITFCKKNNVNYTIIRIPSLYGDTKKLKYKLLYLLSLLFIPIPVPSKQNYRSYLNVIFFINKLKKILLKKKLKANIIYICDKQDYKIEGILNKIIKKKLIFVRIPNNCFYFLKKLGLRINFLNKTLISKNLKNKF